MTPHDDVRESAILHALTEPRDLIDQMVRQAMHLAHADIGLFYNVGRAKGQQITRMVHFVKRDEFKLGMDWVDGMPAPQGCAFDTAQSLRNQRRGHWSVTNPASRHTNAFSCWEDDYAHTQFEQLHIEGEPVAVNTILYSPAEVGDQCRALMYQGRRSLGWLGVLRRGHRERFTPQEHATLQAHARTWQHKLAAIEALQRQGEPDELAYLIVSARGELSWASAMARRWLDSRRIEMLRAWLARERGAPASLTIDGALLMSTPMRLHGHAPELLITIEALMPLMRGALAGLPELTRQVAHGLCAGLSHVELGAQLGLTSHAVRAHRDALCAHLGVDSTVDLLREIDS